MLQDYVLTQFTRRCQEFTYKYPSTSSSIRPSCPITFAYPVYVERLVNKLFGHSFCTVSFAYPVYVVLPIASSISPGV